MRHPVTGFCFLAATPAFAADDGWRSSATLYVWTAGVESQVEFPGPIGTRDISVDAGDIIRNLRFAIMGAATVRKGRVGGFGDIVHARLGDHVEGSRDFQIAQLPAPANVTADLDLAARTTLLTVGGSYALIDSPRFGLHATLGTRHLGLRQTLDFRLTGALPGQPPEEVAGTRRVRVANWDVVGGIAATYRFGQDARWFIPVRLDVGTGGSDLTWQLLGGIGHSFGIGDITLAYRRISYKLNGPIRDFSMDGPALGATLRF